MGKSLKERFEEKLGLIKPGECWVWQGCLGSHGRGSIWVSEKGRVDLAYRVAYQLYVGDIPRGMNVLHKCDNRRCVNPAHLFLGTQKDNLRDCVAKGRARGGIIRGEASSASKLNNAEVVELRRLRGSGVSCANLAKKFGIHVTTVYRIYKGETWSHVA